MAEENVEVQDINYRRVFAWTELFRGFQVAMDPKKLALAAAGIVAMWLGWVILSLIFYGLRSEPRWSDTNDPTAWKDFKEDREKWNILYQAAGPSPVQTDANDLAETPEQWKQIDAQLKQEPTRQAVVVDGKVIPRRVKPYGGLRLWPGSEDRGPNPYHLVTGQAPVPWEAGHFWTWFWTRQVPVVIEPLVKFLRPLVYLLHHKAGFWNHVYFLLALVHTAFVWAIFGGALTRMASVQIARRDKISVLEALRFTWARIVSYFTAPLLPLVGVAVIVVFLIVFGLIHWIPILGDVWSGLLWPVVIVAGLAMAVVLIGLIGWPLMVSTISTEGSDNFDALSRSYSYIYQYPWHYAWYCLVGIVYGAALVFFVGFMGSFLVYLGKWGVEQTPGLEGASRDPSYLFALAPRSFGWRALLMDGAEIDGRPVVADGAIVEDAYHKYLDSYRWYNWVGAFLVGAWTQLVFLLVLGFGYSYFWTASTIIYLLMRRKVDDTEFDEVYLEEEEPEETYSMTTPAPGPPTPSGGGAPGMQMVEAPSLRTSPPPPAPPPEPAGATATPPAPAPSESVPPGGGDGNPPPEGTTP
jgi:hypothetical protein